MTPQLTTPAIETHDLHMSFGDVLVLDGIDLHVWPGTVYALLGPNGSGKTTTVRILTTLLGADAGRVQVGGRDLATEADAVRAQIGVTGQFSAVDTLMTGRENLRLMADLAHLSCAEAAARVEHLLAEVDLADAADRQVSTYSGGMKRRLDLAMTLVSRPSIIFLDEPTTGLDPRSRRAMWHTVRSLVSQGTTVFLTTQYLEEADQLADRIGVLDHGHIVAEGTPTELKATLPGGHILLGFATPEDLDQARAALSSAGTEAATDADGLTVQVPYDGDVDTLLELLTTLRGKEVRVDELSLHTPDLDDVFLALTDHPATEGASR